MSIKLKTSKELQHILDSESYSSSNNGSNTNSNSKSKKEKRVKIKEKGISVLYFYADWCNPCNRIAPFYEVLANTYSDVTFYKLNIDIPDFSRSNNFQKIGTVGSIPVFYFCVKGEIVKTISGSSSQNLLKETVEYYLGM